MVKNDGGQLYTIEGFAAGLIMIITAYLVVNATSVYTAGDTHINDMQLEALGSDALRVMDIPVSNDEHSLMQDIIEDTDIGVNNLTFGTTFSSLVNNKTGSSRDHIQFTANVSYRSTGDTIDSYLLNNTRNLSGGEHSVRATKWVIVDELHGNVQPRAVLVEVLLWRD
jgi:hypothetical protein